MMISLVFVDLQCITRHQLYTGYAMFETKNIDYVIIIALLV